MPNPPEDKTPKSSRGPRVTDSRLSGEARPGEKPQPKRLETSTNAGAKVPTQPQSLVNASLPFKTLGRYTVLKELGRGGMGAVYLAEDTVLKRQVALKIPQFEPHKAEQMQARFVREAQMAASLSHPNICQVFDVGVIDGQYVMAMEYIDGRTMVAYTKPGKLLPERQAVMLVKKIALAVDVAHQRNVIHRDLKPGNIMLPKPDANKKSVEPKVMDFGLAKSLGSGGAELTKSGMIIGTPCYMSKEQWSAKDGQVGPPSDVYSLGMILYEMLTGKLPYDVDDDEPATAWFVRLVTRDQTPPREHKPSIDASLESIVMRSIAIEAEDRYATMAEFAKTLDDWLKGKSGETRTASQSNSDESIDWQDAADESASIRTSKGSRATSSNVLPNARRRTTLATNQKTSGNGLRISPFWLGLAGSGFIGAIVVFVSLFLPKSSELSIVESKPQAAVSTEVPIAIKSPILPESIAETERIEPAVTNPSASAATVGELNGSPGDVPRRLSGNLFGPGYY